MTYDNTDKGALFKNDRKEKDTQPDYKGSLDVKGDAYWLSAWLKESKDGNKYFSLSVQAKDKKYEKPVQEPDNGGTQDSPIDDEIMF